MIKLIVDFIYKTIDKHSGKYLLNLIRCQAIKQHRIIPIANEPIQVEKYSSMGSLFDKPT